MIGLALLGAGRMAKVHSEAISAAGARLVTVFRCCRSGGGLSRFEGRRIRGSDS